MEAAEEFVWPNQRKTGCGGLWGDFCELGGGVGMLSGDKWRLTGREASLDLKRREAGATLLEECMMYRVLKMRHAVEARVEARGPPNLV
jgi:hypothetical protein